MHPPTFTCPSHLPIPVYPSAGCEKVMLHIAVCAKQRKPNPGFCRQVGVGGRAYSVCVGGVWLRCGVGASGGWLRGGFVGRVGRRPGVNSCMVVFALSVVFVVACKSDIHLKKILRVYAEHLTCPPRPPAPCRPPSPVTRCVCCLPTHGWSTSSVTSWWRDWQVCG